MGAQGRHLVRHYAEMVVAMFLGMAVLGMPAGWLLAAAGTSWSELHAHAPALMLILMAVTMTIPMVGWMAYRGHGARESAEMSASMFVPAFGAAGLLWAGAVTDAGALMTIEHVAMLAAMLLVMVMRPSAYARHHGRAEAQVAGGTA